MRTRLGMLCLVGFVLAPGSGQAELRRVEAVGTYRVREALRTKVIVRDRAVENALWEGVSRVALDVIGDGPGEASGESGEEGTHHEGGIVDGGGSSGIDLDTLRAALGKDVLPYTRSFRILEDQGERPVLFEDDPATRTEYVVVVEVLVDVRRVTKALEQAGWIRSLGPQEPNGPQLQLELLGLTRYEALETLVEALGAGLGATRVQLLELSPARQILAVEGRFGVRELEAWLSRFRDPRLRLEAIEASDEGSRLRVRARWTPAADGNSTPGDATQEDGRGASGWSDPTGSAGGSREAAVGN